MNRHLGGKNILMFTGNQKRTRMQRIYKSTQICCVPKSLVLSTAPSLLPPKIRQIKTAKGKKEMLEISISETRNDRHGKQTNILQCRKEMTED